MAKQMQYRWTDDLDGSKAAETVHFGIDGAMYEIDLSKKNAASLRKAVAAYTENGRSVRPSRAQRPARKRSGRGAANPAAVRAWAQENGVKVSDRGRISADVLQQYAAAQH